MSVANSQILNENEISTEKELETRSFFKETLKEILDTFDTPSTKAILKIFISRHFLLKVFLFLFLIGTNGFASYLVIQSVMDYFKYDVTTKSRTIYETPTPFPKVTFCNVNKLQTEYAWNLTSSPPSQPVDDTLLSLDEKRKLGRDLNDILLFCFFEDDPCLISDITWSYDMKYGNCFEFNSGRNASGNKIDLKESSLSGVGLQLMLYVNVYEKLLDVTNQFGAVLQIGNSSFQTLFTYGDGIFASAGSITNIAMDREFKSILPKPYSNCEIDSSNSPQFKEGLDLYNLISQSGYEYTQQLCFYQCFQSYAINKYNCTYQGYISLFNVKECSLNLSYYIWKSGQFLSGKFINENCLSMCPLECEQILYRTSLSSLLLNDNSNINFIQSNPNLSSDFINRTLTTSLRESLVQVNVFYQSLSYTLTTESPQMDAISLFGSIGGNLGLFLGVSVFSLCELIEVTFQVYFILKQRKVSGSI